MRVLCLDSMNELHGMNLGGASGDYDRGPGNRLAVNECPDGKELRVCSVSTFQKTDSFQLEPKHSLATIFGHLYSIQAEYIFEGPKCKTSTTWSD